MASRNNSGMSLVEILLAVALSAVFVFPMLGFLQSIQPGFIEKRLGFIWSDDPLHETVHVYDKFLNSSRKELGQEKLPALSQIVLYNARGVNSCRDFDPVGATVKIIQSSDIHMSSTSIPTQIKALGNELLLAVNSSSTTEPDLMIFEASNDKLTYKSSIDFGPGAIDMNIQGYYAYIANMSVLSQAKSVDLSGNTKAVKMNFLIPGSNSTTTPISKKIVGYKNLLIVGTEKSLLPEIAVFDASMGKYIAYIDTEYGINSLMARNDKLIVLGPSNPEMEIYDLMPALEDNIQTPRKLEKIHEYDAVGGSGNGRSMDVLGDFLVFGRTKGGEELQLLSVPIFEPKGVSTTSSTTKILASKKINASVDAVIADAENILVFAFDAVRELQIYQQKNSVLFGGVGLEKIAEFDLPNRVAGAVCINKSLFVAIKDSQYPLAIISNE